MSKKPNITHQRLLQLLDYNPETGEFFWKSDRGRLAKKGGVAGTIDGGYVKIIIEGKKYSAHRLAMFYMTGEWPPMKIDHFNTNGIDNRFANLRNATDLQNAHNKNKYKNNTSGYKGVSWKPQNKKYQASIQFNGKQLYLGLYDTAEEAYEIYCQKARELHGEFANFG